jgi:hypothetical protein
MDKLVLRKKEISLRETVHIKVFREQQILFGSETAR